MGLLKTRSDEMGHVFPEGTQGRRDSKEIRRENVAPRGKTQEETHAEDVRSD